MTLLIWRISQVLEKRSIFGEVSGEDSTWHLRDFYLSLFGRDTDGRLNIMEKHMHSLMETRKR